MFYTITTRLFWILARLAPPAALYGILYTIPDSLTTVEPGEELLATIAIASIAVEILRYFLATPATKAAQKTKLLPLILILTLLLPSCLSLSKKFVDGTDNSSVEIKDRSLLSKRETDATDAAYEWDATGSGKWTMGATTEGADSTALVPIIQAISEGIAKALTQLGLAYIETLTPPPLLIPELTPLTP